MLSAYQQRLTLGNPINNNIITTRQKGMVVADGKKVVVL